MTANMKKKITFILFLSLGILTETIAQTPTTGKNAVMEKTPREAITTLSGATHTTVQTAIQYFDGLGKPTQAVVYKGSPDATKDILSSTTLYDNLGRAYKNILPSPSDVATGAYKSSAQSLATNFYDNDANPYAETIFEASPLNRPKQQFGVGQAWRVGAGHSVGMEYLTAGTEILHFEIRASGTIEKVGTYAGNSLTCTRTTSERDFKTNEYKDRLGRVVAKSQELTAGNFAISLYIYDDLNRLRIIIPPEAYQTVSIMSSFTISSPVFLEGMFSYVYDSRGRLAEKHIPGAGTVRYVYDKNDRVVLENDDRDASIIPASSNYYKFFRYDLLGRVIQTGLIFGIGTFSRSQLQTDFDNHTALTYEERITTGGLLGYTNRSFPSGYTPIESSFRTVTYYDDYLWQLEGKFEFKDLDAFHAQANAKGMVTGSLIRNLKTNTWQKRVMYYDYQGHEIQNYYLSNRNNLIRKDFQYRFNGELLKIRIEKKSGTTVLSTKLLSYEYDHLSRKVKYKYSLNGNEKTIAAYSYDAVGRMSKKLYSPSTAISSSQTGLWTNTVTWQGGSIPTLSDQVTVNSGHIVTIPASTTVSAGTLFDKGILQNYGTLSLGTLAPSTSGGTLHTLDFKYYIRGLKGINLDASGNLTNNIFSYRLDYEEGTTGLFDGNIKKQYWKSNIDGKERSFDFLYDGASRILSASYASLPTGENYALNNVTYDANGNIKTLSRSGATNTNYTAFGNVDNLTYTYQSNSNKLSKIADATTANADLGDFRDGINTDDDYEYWLDGSLKKDKNKNISTISYNYLDLPEVITFDDTKTITTEYDAAGIKLKKIVSGGETTDYEEDDIYVNGVLYQTSHDEGRIVNGVYEYNITDHNNDLRVAFRDSLGIAVPTQSIFYDPWGLSMKGMQITRNPLNFNKFQFLNHELQVETGLVDLLYRQYNPQIGRFLSPDPVIEGQEHLSLYQYGWNNPILRPDPNGQYPDGGEDDVNSEFFLARLVTTAFYDVKHAIFNTGARVAGSNFRASYAKNSDGQEIFETSYGKIASPSTLKEVGKEILSAGLDAMVVSGVKAGPAGIGVLAESSETQTSRGVKNVAENLSRTGKYSEPTLPDKTVVKQDGVEVKHYYKSGDHAPAHMHVKGQGSNTKIGANGKPVKGSPELSKSQSEVIDANISKIRSAGRKINNYQKYQNYRKEE
jgi:RHS repeat-associated protein